MRFTIIVCLLLFNSLAQAQQDDGKALMTAKFERLMSLSAQARLAEMRQDYDKLSRAERRAYHGEFKARYEIWSKQNPSQKTPAAATQPRTTPRPKVPGTFIQYDTGTVVGTSSVSSNMVGNVFDTALNLASTGLAPVESAGSVTQVTIHLSAVSGNVFLTLMSAANFTNGTANLVASPSLPAVSGLETYTNPFGTDNVYAQAPFLVGAWQFNGAELVGLDTGSISGQGFHAVHINDTVGTNLRYVNENGNDVANPSANAIVRVRGNVRTPVELLNFSIE